MSKKATAFSAARDVVELIGAGLDAKKCRRCGKMADVIAQAERAFAASEDLKARGMAEKVGELRGRTLKQASGDFGCGGCWGAKVRKKLSKSFKPAKKGKLERTAREPEIIEAAGSRPMRRDGKGAFAIELRDGFIRCLHFAPRGNLAHVVTGRNAAAIAVAVADAGFVKRVEVAAYLGWELARAEAALASGEPYVARPWGAERG